MRIGWPIVVATGNSSTSPGYRPRSLLPVGRDFDFDLCFGSFLRPKILSPNSSIGMMLVGSGVEGAIEVAGAGSGDDMKGEEGAGDDEGRFLKKSTGNRSACGAGERSRSKSEAGLLPIMESSDQSN